MVTKIYNMNEIYAGSLYYCILVFVWKYSKLKKKNSNLKQSLCPLSQDSALERQQVYSVAVGRGTESEPYGIIISGPSEMMSMKRSITYVTASG